MILIVSHFTKNKGVTDYFVEFLKKQEKDFYILKHSYTFIDTKFSELYLYSDGRDSLIKKYKKINNVIINLILNFFVSIRVSYLLGKRVNKVIGFGGFNIMPFIIFNKFFKRDLYFWGVDYSRKRFRNIFMNKIYRFFETLSCKYCSVVINQTKRQEEARIQFHNLKSNKSIVIANGIKIENLNIDFSKFNESAFLYIGSITKQHGIIDFVNYFYIENNSPYSLYIIGGGKEIKTLEHIIKNANLDKKIYYLGYKTQPEIIRFLLGLNNKLFGIAPYDDRLNDHVFFGDSLKIKEYLNYNIPYITSNITYVPEELRKFGITYTAFKDLSESLEYNLTHFKLNIEEKNEALFAYDWENIFKKVVELIKV